jgi:hypothetical protein
MEQTFGSVGDRQVKLAILACFTAVMVGRTTSCTMIASAVMEHSESRGQWGASYEWVVQHTPDACLLEQFSTKSESLMISRIACLKHYLETARDPAQICTYACVVG